MLLSKKSKCCAATADRAIARVSRKSFVFCVGLLRLRPMAYLFSFFITDLDLPMLKKTSLNLSQDLCAMNVKRGHMTGATA